MKEPLLLIVNYILETKNVFIKIKSIESFFEDGYFPLFISKILNIPFIYEIEGEKYQREQKDIENNNKVALKILFEYNEKIKEKNPPFETMEDKIQLLILVLTNQCFPLDYDAISKKIKFILPYQVYRFKSLYSFKCVAYVLFISSNTQFPYLEDPKTVQVLCHKCKIPYVINEKSLEEKNKYTFLIQIQILFDFFTCCTKEMHQFIKKTLDKYIPIKYKDTSLSISPYIYLKVEDLNEEEEEEYEESNEPFVPLNERLSSIQGKLVNYSKNIYDYSKNIDDLKTVINLWNSSLNNHSYYNGILIDKLNPKFNFNSNSNQKGFKRNLAQFFVYDEKELHWRFCKKAFEDLFQMKLKYQKIPLVLFMDSDFQSVLNFCSIFKKDILSYNFKNDISVFAFNQENPSNGDKYCFLFVFVPEEKISHKNIQSILYQIYTFLYLICDETIVIFSENNKDILKQQIIFTSNIIKISDLYLKNSNNHDGEEQNTFNFIDHSKIIFIDNFEKDCNKQLEALIKENIKTNYHLKYIIDKDSFLPIFCDIDIELENCYEYPKLLDAFTYINSKFSEISEKYIIISFNCNNDENKLNFIREILDTRFTQLFYKTKYANDKKNIIVDLEIEAAKFYPNIDEEFVNFFRLLLLKKAVEVDKIYNTIFAEQLDAKAKSHLDYLKKKMNMSHYLTENQYDTFLRSHDTYLQKQLFEIIKSTFRGPLNFAFELLKDTLYKQTENDKAELLECFTEFQKKKAEKKQEDFNTTNKKGTNYVIKEVEKTREIEVMIDSEEELEKIIPQDF